MNKMIKAFKRYLNNRQPQKLTSYQMLLTMNKCNVYRNKKMV
jgi:hypothetical protein